MSVKRVILTAGEPAGIGPEILVRAAQQHFPIQLIACCDPNLLHNAAAALNLPLKLVDIDWHAPAIAHQPGQLFVDNVYCAEPPQVGQLNPANASYVLETLRKSTERIHQQKLADALVTAPVNKAVINNAGFKFSGHTEFLQAESGCESVVMMLATEGLRVTLATTHLPLREVADAIQFDKLQQTIQIILKALKKQFGIAKPRLGICGLNPHAGENGHLGSEERDIINPCVQTFQAQGENVSLALPADTIFTPRYLQQFDCILAMYHDQGLAVLKHVGFERASNITLGLPFVRTSVDHGTALDIAPKYQASASSLIYAIHSAIEMINH